MKSSDFNDNKNPADTKVIVTGTVTSHDEFGNVVTQPFSHNVDIDNHAEATITVDNLSTLNSTALSSDVQWVTGTVGGDASVGDQIYININGHSTTYPGYVIDLGGGHLGYKIAVPSFEFGANSHNIDGEVTVSAGVISQDRALNYAIGMGNNTVHIDNHAENHVNIHTVADDDVVNRIESRMPTLISGDVTGVDAKEGDVVTVSIDGKDVQLSVPGKVVMGDDGHLRYEVFLPSGKEQPLHEGENSVQITVISHDGAGNEAIATDNRTIVLDTEAHATITIGDISDGNRLNHTDLLLHKQLITGTVGGDAKLNDGVTITINGHDFPGKVVDLDGHNHLGYRISVDSSVFGDNDVNLDADVYIRATVTSHDKAGNETLQHTDRKVHIDNHAEATATIGTVSGDDIINKVDSGKEFTTISGAIGGAFHGDINTTSQVQVWINGHEYSAKIGPLASLNGALGYTADVKTSDILASVDEATGKSEVTVFLYGHDGDGNQYRSETSKDVIVDLEAKASISIDLVTGDKMINGDEANQDFTMITGKVGDDVHKGDVVHLHINGHDLTTRVTPELTYSFKVSTADLIDNPEIKVTVSTTDNANNPASDEKSQTVIIDTQVEGTISVNDVTSDNTLNATELGEGKTRVSGKVTGEVPDGADVVLTVNHHMYHGTVKTLENGERVYHADVKTSDLKADPDFHVNVSVTDDAGNHRDVGTDHHVNIDDHADATLTINVVSGDDVLNANEQNSTYTTINGYVGGDVKEGNTVYVTVNGEVHEATVKPQPYLNGALGYSLEVKTSDLVASPKISATVSAHDVAGNEAHDSAIHYLHTDNGAKAEITVDKVTPDNLINNKEAHQETTTITGTVNGNVHPGDSVELEVNGVHYFGQVSPRGDGLGYSIDVSTTDLISTGEPVIHAFVTGRDDAGNVQLGTAEHVVKVDTRADIHLEHGTVTQDRPIGPDYYIVTGHIHGDDANISNKVDVTVGGKHFDGEVTVLPDGQLGYTCSIDAWVFKNNSDITVKISATDPHGNIATQTDQIHVNIDGHNSSNPNGEPTTPHDHTPNVIVTLHPVAGDNVINQRESGSPETVIRGTVKGDAVPGDTLVVHIGSYEYTGTIEELPNLPGEYGFAVNVETSAFANHPDFTVTVIHNGNGYFASGQVTVDTHIDASISLDNIAQDNVINGEEAKSGKTPVTGIVTGEDVHEGSTVTLTVNGQHLTTQVFRDLASGELRFSKDVSIDDLRHDPHITATVEGEDVHGNTMTSDPATQNITVDTEATAEVKIDSITADNVLNLAETQDTFTEITGHVQGDLHSGEFVTLKVNGATYQAQIDDSLNFHTDVKTADLKADVSHTIVASVTGHDAAGNLAPVSDLHQYSIDTQASANITINVVGGDDILNGDELQSDFTQVSGRVSGDVHKGDEVVIMVNGYKVTTHVEELPNLNGVLGYHASVPNEYMRTSDQQTEVTITASVTGKDAHENLAFKETPRVVHIDDHADVTLHFNAVADDNVLNAEEVKSATTKITGTVEGDVNDGEKVTITVNGNNIPATIHKDAITGVLGFSVTVSTSELLNDQAITYKVTGTDAAGNVKTITEQNTIHIDQEAKASIHIDANVSGDDTVNLRESQHQYTVVTGTVGDDVRPGADVTLTVNGKTFHGTVENDNGHLSYKVHVENNALHEGANVLNVSVVGQDAAGNISEAATDNHTITLDTKIVGSINIDPVATDNVISAQEAQNIVVTGVVGDDAKLNDIVTLHINGHTITTTVIPVGNHLGYSIALGRQDLHEGENTIKVSVEVSDEAGNKTTAYHDQVVQVDTRVDATIGIDPVAQDDVVNAKEADHLVVTGLVEGDAKLHDLVTIHVNGHDITTHVKDFNGRLGYEASVAKTYLHEGSNDLSASVKVSDQVGNIKIVESQLHPIQVDTHADAHVLIDKLPGHNHLSAAQAHDGFTHITGTVSGDVIPGDSVEVEVHGIKYTTVLDAKLGYDVAVNNSNLHVGDNKVNVLVTACDEHGNVTPHQSAINVMVDAPDNSLHDPKHKLSNLFADSPSFEKHRENTTAAAEGTKGHHDDLNAKNDGRHDSVALKGSTYELHEIVADSIKHAQPGESQQADKSHLDGKHELSKLFADDDESLSFGNHHGKVSLSQNVIKDHRGEVNHETFTGKSTESHDNMDLKALARELHDDNDLSKHIKFGDESQDHADSGRAAHTASTVTPAQTIDAPASHDAHSTPVYSLDHLLHKPEHYSH
ncbi:Ig-like domain-containing protein [Buttiauxella sp. B2]|uniref:Ig-like domain-containing protein n=1 Tax=Buttiauxella sp. B2 TaxID=2587812 RepID=UPI001CB960C7|nr:Ig-like domain-containing protein [Buttiauxella sp. B2]